MVSQDKDLEDYDPADIAMALCRMVSYNIGHLAYLNAKRYGLPRVFFGGFFIRGHPYTMETISFAIRFWSKLDKARVLKLLWFRVYTAPWRLPHLPAAFGPSRARRGRVLCCLPSKTRCAYCQDACFAQGL